MFGISGSVNSLNLRVRRITFSYSINLKVLKAQQKLDFTNSLRDRSLFIPQRGGGGGTEEKLKKVYIKKLPNRSGCSIFFTQPLIEIQNFKAAFVNLTRNDCFICFCHCVFHVYVINCVNVYAIMFSFPHWSFFSPNPLDVSKISYPPNFSSVPPP